MLFKDLLDFIISVWNLLLNFGRTIVDFFAQDLSGTIVGDFLGVFGVESASVIEILFGGLVTSFIIYSLVKWVIPT